MLKPHKLIAGIIFAVIAVAIIVLVISMKAEHATGQPTSEGSSLTVVPADSASLGQTHASVQSAGGLQTTPADGQALQQTGNLR